MNRRQLLGSFAALFGLVSLPACSRGAPTGSGAATTGTKAMSFTPLDLAKADWRKLLPRDRYLVLFEEDTERAFTSPLNDEKRTGTFICAACNLPLFASDAKYDSGTGWPSFFQPIAAEHIGTKTDYKLILPRTEYHCARCGGHQGHVFEDGPEPTGLRYCNNGLALEFVAEGEPLPTLREG